VSHNASLMSHHETCGKEKKRREKEKRGEENKNIIMSEGNQLVTEQGPNRLRSK
jgi:hypothetical protein